MTCTECGSQSEDFEYCNYSMCNFPVCSKCAIIHSLKETFRQYPTSDKVKNEFFEKVKSDYLKQKIKGDKK